MRYIEYLISSIRVLSRCILYLDAVRETGDSAYEEREREREIIAIFDLYSAICMPSVREESLWKSRESGYSGRTSRVGARDA